MKTLLATIVGLIVSFIVVFAMEFLSMTLFPSPEKIDPTNVEALKTLIQHIPIAALLMILLGHGLALFLASYYAFKIQPNSLVPFLIIFIFMLIGTISNLAMIPHPMWFMVADVSTVVVSGLIAWRSFFWK